jgi:pimeloyl-ACP methyl ester carboxylesterase
MRTVFLDPAEVTDTLVEEEWRINNSPGADAVFAALARYFVERLDEEVVGPTLAALSPRPPLELVWGAQDRSVPLAVGHEAARILAPAPLHVIEGAAHAPYHEQPAAFNALIPPFLATCSDPRAAARPSVRTRSRTTTQGD